jgi:hypothetical protein
VPPDVNQDGQAVMGGLVSPADVRTPTALGSAITGGAIGGVTAGPIGALIGTIVGGLVGALLNNWSERHARQSPISTR